MKNKYILADIDKIVFNPNQPRTEINTTTINELAESIKKVGILQPLVVRMKENKFELIAGERRLRAAISIGLEKVPVMLYEVNDIGSTAIALIENIQREQLNFMDEAISYRKLIKYHGVTQQQIAKLIGKSQSSVANKIRLLKHSDEVIKKIRKNKLSERHSRAFLKIDTEQEKLEVIKIVFDKKLNIIDTEKLIENRDYVAKKKSRKIKGIIGNDKIYINTIKNAYKIVKDSGANAHYDIKEDEKEYIITIKIEK